MKRFLLGVVISFCVLSALWLLGIRAQLNTGTPSSRWVFDAYQHKLAIANTNPKNRTLIVAGSNAMFGINSSLIENYWHRPTINLGVNAGLGLPYILYLTKQIAQPGDVILMPMEYALYLDNGEPNSQIIDYVVARDPTFLQTLSPAQYLYWTFSMSPERWIQGLRRPHDVPVISGTYGAHHLDLHGDQIQTSEVDQTKENKASVEHTKNWHYGARAIIEKGGWNEIASFSQWAKINRICVIAIPTVLLHHTQYDTDLIEKKFYDDLPRKITNLGIPFIGNPRDFMYPSNWFFDTDHHLKDWARNRHTENLIRILNPNPLSYCK